MPPSAHTDCTKCSTVLLFDVLPDLKCRAWAPLAVIAAAAFVWAGHRKYKRLLYEAQNKNGN